MLKIRLTQIDGKFPNLALMKLNAYYKQQGHQVYFERSINRGLFEPEYDLVFGSSIFTSSKQKIEMFRQNFQGAIIRGTGTDSLETVEQFLGIDQFEQYDYDIYPEFQNSIGFTQRGCRLRCKFCVVPQKEGKNKSINSISKIWRGEPYPKNIHLLDNDFFGQHDWKDKIQEAIDGGFKISFSQGINIRLIDEEGAKLLAKVKYYDDQFKTKRIYTAWDNKRDEKIFIKGINHLLNAGIKPNHIMVYFLCNYWEKGLTEDIWYRYNKMKEIGLMPYPMIYDRPNANNDLKRFQSWVVMRGCNFIPFDQWRTNHIKELQNSYLNAETNNGTEQNSETP